ncbi:LAME_0F16644g1_1 [Lachancea meyersii CBS 8951]|uniref:ubiquitinyl hydrolase 1 n=1 Tax=Lachancea meyersii CBS 8951 TaxID=1266667 RepID=A0A1G4JZC5_9SACH|nr:LAME_0F16644g1_1 [Lachancea meyersii CBS 8951]
MQPQETAKPLVDRILAQPLQFQVATKPDILEENLGSYIVIGKSSIDGSTGTTGTGMDVNNGGALQSQQTSFTGSKLGNGKGKTWKSMPRSFSEALEMYTAKKPVANVDADLSDGKYASSNSSRSSYQGNDEDEDDGVSANDSSSELSSESANDEFHEAQEYAEMRSDGESEDVGEDVGEGIGEDVGEDIGEDVGDDVGKDLGEDEQFPNEHSADVDNDDDDNDDDENNKDHEENDLKASGSDQTEDEDFRDDEDQNEHENALSGSEDSDSSIADSEKLGLIREAQEYAQMDASDLAAVPEPVEKEEEEDEGAAEDELKHKLPQSKRPSPTPPTVLSDIDQFYQFNENFNDRGSNKSTRILKNWGPQLTKLRPKGLLNHGVTCYTNAAVQAMIHIPAIQHYLFDVLRGEYKSTIKPQSVTHVLAETTKKMLSQESSKSQFINPKKLIGRLDDINCMMSEWQQEDSHEYFMSLMSRLQEDGVPRGHKLTESIMYDIFGGLLRQEVTCKSCGQVSKTEQPIYDLSLHLKGKKNPETTGSINADSEDEPQRRFSIEKSIRDFFNPELIKADKATKEGYFCEKCQKTTNASKHNFILRAPETLLVHLKKFRFNGTSSSKMKQAVSYPMFLDLTEFCEDAQKSTPVKYQLVSVVVHEGRSLSSGHYIAHCKQPDGSWVTYDDEYINKISERQILKEPGAYYLVYTRLTHKSIPLSAPSGTSGSETARPSGYSTNSSSSSGSKKKKKNKGKNKSKKRRLDN